MSVIDLLRSPLAIAGIVGSITIGGGLTVYVIRDGNPADAFPSIFVVETLGDRGIGGGRCELDANVASGCTFRLPGNISGTSYITFRRHDKDPSRVVVSGQQYGKHISQVSYGKDIIGKGFFFGSEGVQVLSWEGKDANRK